MNDSELYSRFALASGVVAGLGTAGAWFLLFAPKTLVGRTVAATVSVLVASGLVALLVPEYLGWVAGGGTVIATLAVLISTATARRLATQCLSPLSRPRIAGAAAVLAAGSLWGYEAWSFDHGYEVIMDETLAQVSETTLLLDPSPVAQAYTDKGIPIPLHAVTKPLSTAESAALEQSAPSMSSRKGLYIRRGAAADESNCHGWVFTGGRYQVLGRNVDTILADNGYQVVTTPVAGDLCVYRDHEQVTHTAVVRAVLNDGMVLVESKWGRLGVYLHNVTESTYGADFRYYRTARGEHLLRGLSGTDDPTAEKPHAVETAGG